VTCIERRTPTVVKSTDLGLWRLKVHDNTIEPGSTLRYQLADCAGDWGASGVAGV
jgi:hypothetical protein